MYTEDAAICEGKYLSMLYSVRVSSERYLLSVCVRLSDFEAFEKRRRKCSGVLALRLKSRVVSMSLSILRISSRVYALSAMWMKSRSSGEYISSYLDARSMAVIPTSWSFVRVMGFTDRKRSTRFTDRNMVSVSNLNLTWTSTIQSTKIARILSVMSTWSDM